MRRALPNAVFGQRLQCSDRNGVTGLSQPAFEQASNEIVRFDYEDNFLLMHVYP